MTTQHTPAPKLLEALKGMVRAWEVNKLGDTIAYENAVKVIAEAQGEPHTVTTQSNRVKVKKFFAVQFANNVPEYDGAWFDTEEEALANIKDNISYCYVDRPYYVFELKGTVQLGYEEVDSPTEPWRRL